MINVKSKVSIPLMVNDGSLLSGAKIASLRINSTKYKSKFLSVLSINSVWNFVSAYFNSFFKTIVIFLNLVRLLDL